MAKDELSGLTHEELHQLRHKIYEDMISIKDQLETARSEFRRTGKYADPDWYRKANSALKFKQRDHQNVLLELSIRNNRRKENNASNFNNVFVQVAEETLDNDTFVLIRMETKNRIEAEDEA